MTPTTIFYLYSSRSYRETRKNNTFAKNEKCFLFAPTVMTLLFHFDSLVAVDYVYLTVCLSVCLSVCLTVCLSYCLSVCLYVCMSVHLSVSPMQCFYLSLALPRISLTSCLSVGLSICLSVRSSVRLSICPSDHPLFHPLVHRLFRPSVTLYVS